MKLGEYPNPGMLDCPYCSTPCECDQVDVGVGMVQCGPYHCCACGATEIGPYDDGRELTEDETKTGWYGPGTPPGSSANQINGNLVSAKVMDKVYRDRFTGSPDYDEPGVVEEWWKQIRGSK